MLVRSFVSIMSSSVVSGVQNKIVCDHRQIQARHMSQAYFIIVNQADLIKNKLFLFVACEKWLLIV